MYSTSCLKKPASEDQTLNKYAFDDQNLSYSKRKDQGDSDGSLSTYEATLSRENLSSILFKESVEIQLIIPLAAKEFQTNFQHRYPFRETSQRLHSRLSKTLL